jgi:hypothetical protein
MDEYLILLKSVKNIFLLDCLKYILENNPLVRLRYNKYFETEKTENTII